MVCGMGRPPALLGIPGLESTGYEPEESSVGRLMGENDSSPIEAGAAVVEGVTTAAVVDVDGPPQGASASGWGRTIRDGEAATANDRSSSSSETLDATYAAGVSTEGVEVAAGAALEDDTVAAAAKECAAYEEVSGVITAAYSARCGGSGVSL